MQKVNDAAFETEVLEAPGLVVLDFGATWCGPCKKLDPIMEELAVEYDGRVTIRKVDVGEAPNVARRYNVLSVPQILYFQGGEVVAKQIGLVPKAKIKVQLDQLLAVQGNGGSGNSDSESERILPHF